MYTVLNFIGLASVKPNLQGSRKLYDKFEPGKPSLLNKNRTRRGCKKVSEKAVKLRVIVIPLSNRESFASESAIKTFQGNAISEGLV